MNEKGESTMEESNKKFWNRFAGLYAPFVKNMDRMYDDVCKQIAKDLTPEMKVLELACGTGQITFRLADKVKVWDATDFSEKMIEEIKRQGSSPGLEFSVQDATCLPYENHTYDAVVIANALHIMPHPEKALAEISRVLKPRGILFAPTFVQSKNIGFRIRMGFLELFGFKIFHKWTSGEYVQYIETHGLKVLEYPVMGSTFAPICCLSAKKANHKKSNIPLTNHTVVVQ